MLEPSANLLAKARMQLDEALDRLPTANWFMRAQQSFFRGLGTLGRAPVAASVLLLAGVGGGSLAGYRYAVSGQPAPAVLPASISGPGTIANVSSIDRDPNSETVKVYFNRLVPETTQGTLDDPKIRELLLAGTQSQQSPVAQNSVSLLAEECQG